MSRLFESVEFQNRSWDVRLLESVSLHSVFVWLVFVVFMLGAEFALALYAFVQLHHFAWTLLMNIPLLGFFAFRCARLIYRRLER